MTEYCRRKQISYHAFNYWKRKFERYKASSPITLVKLEESKEVISSPDKPKVCISSPLRFWVKDFCIEVDRNFSPEAFRQLVHTLRSI